MRRTTRAAIMRDHTAHTADCHGYDGRPPSRGDMRRRRLPATVAQWFSPPPEYLDGAAHTRYRLPAPLVSLPNRSKPPGLAEVAAPAVICKKWSANS